MARGIPPVRYADNQGIEIAYQVIGDSGPTLMGVPGLAENIELIWEDARARWLRSIGSFCRLIHFDKRGTGMSARAPGFSSFPERVSDLEAVMRAENVEEAFIGGFSEGGTMSAFFAATHPERTLGLILIGTTACYLRREDMPWNHTLEDYEALAELWSAGWGRGDFTVRILAPSMTKDRAYVEWMARYERQALTPRGMIELWRMNVEIDVRSVLPSIQASTLVIQRRFEGDLRNAEYLASHIPGGRLVVVEGADHLPWIGDQEPGLQAMQELITGGHRPISAQRALATVMFTDIVDSTRLAGRLGDAAWAELLDVHDAHAREAVLGSGGVVVKSTGDGVLATFDSPSRAMESAQRLRYNLARAGVEVRVGLHTGEIERRGDDVGGIGVNIAARIEGCARPGEILVSRTVKDLSAGAGFSFEDRGSHDLKGIDEPWQIFLLAG